MQPEAVPTAMADSYYAATPPAKPHWRQRPPRSAKDRRAQALRAQGRVVQARSYGAHAEPAAPAATTREVTKRNFADAAVQVGTLVATVAQGSQAATAATDIATQTIVGLP